MAAERDLSKKELKHIFRNPVEVTEAMYWKLIDTLWRDKYTMRTSGFVHAGSPDSVIAFDAVTRIFSITPRDPEVETYKPRFSFYTYNYTAHYEQRYKPEFLELPDVEGLYVIYYDTDEYHRTHKLFSLRNPDEYQLRDIYYDKVIVAFIYWDAVAKQALHFGDSRHGSEWQPQMHLYLHTAFNARRKNGLVLTGTSFGGDGSQNAHAQFSVTGGTMLHDDFEMDIPGSSNSLPILYQYGTLPRYHTKTGYAIYQLSSRACYNSGGAVIPADEGFHVLYHIFATNEIGIANRKIISVMGRWHYETLAEAYAAAPGELDYALSWMPQQGRLHIATIVVQTSDAYTNDIHSRIVGIWGEGHPPVTIAENSKEILHITDRQELSIDLDAVVQEVDAEGTATEVVSTMIGNCKESFLIENTAATEIEQLSSWKVEAFNELVGDFNAIAVIRDKTANTVINLKNLLGFDFTEAANEVESDNKIVANAGATLQLSVDPSTNFLKAALSGMAANPKRIFFCFERCCLSVRPLFIQGAINGSSTFAGSLRGIGGLAGTIAGGSDMAGTLTQAGGGVTEVNYGLLYNWFAGTDARKITSSDDWQVLESADILDLVNYISGGSYVIGDITFVDINGFKLRETGIEHWIAPNNTATNEYNLSLRAGGGREENGSFAGIGTSLISFTADVDGADSPYSLGVFYMPPGFDGLSVGGAVSKKFGFSLILVSDATGVTDGEIITYTGNDLKKYTGVAINGKYYVATVAETKYRNGDTIPEVTDNAAWAALTTGALCAYNNDWNNV